MRARRVTRYFLCANCRTSGRQDDPEERAWSRNWILDHDNYIAEMVLGLIASIIVMWFSRQREFRADQGGAALAGRGAMIGALQRLQDHADGVDLPDQLAAFAISGKFSSGLARLMRSHPPIEERIERLSQGMNGPVEHDAADSSDHPFN